MRQRVMIAMALACEPPLLLADEPTTALDVTIQAQILELMSRSRGELGIAMLIITHNLGVVARYADRVNVMYAGRIVEQGTAPRALRRPAPPLHARRSSGRCRGSTSRAGRGSTRSRACRPTSRASRRAARSRPAARSAWSGAWRSGRCSARPATTAT